MKWLQFSSVEVEEEGTPTPDSPLSPSLKEDVAKEEGAEADEERSPDSKQLLPKSSLRMRSKRKKSISPQNANGGNGDCESQNSFSRTSSTCGYRESFGNYNFEFFGLVTAEVGDACLIFVFNY